MGKMYFISYRKGSNTEVGYFFTRNAQGDIIGVYRNSDSKLIGTYEYDLWGRPVSVKGAEKGIDKNGILTKNPLRYRGYYYDEETGFYYLNARYYDPEVRRFISADSLEYLGANGTIIGYNVFAYCGGNPVNRKDPAGHSWISALFITAVIVYTAAMSGCSKPPTSDVGAAMPYVDMPGSMDPNSPNCYAYAIGSSVNEQPGATSGRIPTKWNDVTDVGKSVEADLKKKGYSVREISGCDAKVYKNEYKIALRVGTKPYAYNRFTGEMYYDYHFMRQTDTGQWAEKHGIGGASVLWDVGMTPDNISWTLDNVPYYDSPIIYYAIGK